jgi:hypothetical protein
MVRAEQLTAPRAGPRRRIARGDPHLDPTVRYIDLRRARTEPSDRADEDPTRTREYRPSSLDRSRALVESIRSES